MTDSEKVKAMKDKVAGVVEKLKEEGQAVEIVFVRLLNRRARTSDFTMIEARFANVKQASEVRTNFIKKRDSTEMEDINVIPTVRLATRVRIEVMQAVARLIKQNDATVSKTQCLQFVCKPVMKVFRKDSAGNEFPRVMTFIDVVSWALENNVQKQVDLGKAYEKAGSSFRGTLAQHFVIMS
jgi:hypothetical protein